MVPLESISLHLHLHKIRIIYTTDLVVDVNKDGTDWLKHVHVRYHVRVLFVPRGQQLDVTSAFLQLANDVFEFRGGDRRREWSVAVLLTHEHLEYIGRNGNLDVKIDVIFHFLNVFSFTFILFKYLLWVNIILFNFIFVLCPASCLRSFKFSAIIYVIILLKIYKSLF